MRRSRAHGYSELRAAFGSVQRYASQGAKDGKRLLHVVILTGPKRGDEVHLPRICCDSAEDTDLPFALRRYQFPVRLAWAMTINKSQGQTFGERIGIYLNKPAFAHGQLYCAMSRATRAEHVRILANEFEQQQNLPRTKMAIDVYEHSI